MDIKFVQCFVSIGMEGIILVYGQVRRDVDRFNYTHTAHLIKIKHTYANSESAEYN